MSTYFDDHFVYRQTGLPASLASWSAAAIMFLSCQRKNYRSGAKQVAPAAACQTAFVFNRSHQESGLAKHKQGVVVNKIDNKRRILAAVLAIVILQSVNVRCDDSNTGSATSSLAAIARITQTQDSAATRSHQKSSKTVEDFKSNVGDGFILLLTGNGSRSIDIHSNYTSPIEAPPSGDGHQMASQPLADMGAPASANELPHPVVTTRRPPPGRTSSAIPQETEVTSSKPLRTSSITQSSPKSKSVIETSTVKPSSKGSVAQSPTVETNRSAKHGDRESNFTTPPTHNDSSVAVPETTLSSDNRTLYDPLYEMSMNAWSWHFHVFGIAFCLLGILSTYSLLHFVFCLNVLQRLYFFLSNLCLCLFCLLRCCYVMRADAYRATSLPYAVAMYDSSTMLITLAAMLLYGGACTFSEVQWWLFRPIRATVVNAFVIPYGVVATSLLVVIVVVGGTWWADDVTTYYLILIQKSVSVLWSVAFVVLSWLLYGRLYKDSLRKQSQILRTELTKLHIEGTQLPRNIPKPCLCLCVRSLFVTACLLLIFNALLVYGLIYSQDMTLSLLAGRIGSPHWWIYQNVTCVFEVGMCACLACGHCWSHCGHQCRSLLGKRIAEWDFRRDVWQTSARRLRRLSEQRFRRRSRGGAGADGRCRAGGVEAGDDYDVIERLAAGGNNDGEYPASFFGIYGNGGSGVAGGRGVSSSTHFTFERWERSYNNRGGNRAVATDTATDLSNTVLSGNELATRHPQHSHHYFHTATVRPVLKTFQRLSQVSPQRLQAQLRSSTLALQRKGRHVSSAVVSSLRSLTTSRRSSSSSCSSGNVVSAAGQLGLSVVTPVKFSTSPRFCGVVGSRKADYVNVPADTTTTINCGSGLKQGTYQKHGRQNNLLNVQENATICESPHVILRKRYLNKRMLEKSCKRKRHSSNKASCCGGQDDDVTRGKESIATTSIARQQHYVSPTAAAAEISLEGCQKSMEKRKMTQRGGKKAKGKVKEFANKVLMVSRATQVYIPSPCKAGGRTCFLPETESMTGSRCGTDRRGVEEEDENGEEEFEYDDDQDLISAANKYRRTNSNRTASSPSPYHHPGALKRSWHHAGNSSTSCSSESAANSFDVRFYVYSPSPGDASPLSSPSRDFHDHFYPKLYRRHHHNHHRRHQRNHHNGKLKNCHRHGSSDFAAATTEEELPVQCPRTTFVDPYSTVDRSGTNDVIGKQKFLPRLTSSSMLEFGPAKASVVSHHCRAVSDAGTGSHYAATQLVAPRETLVVTAGSSINGSTESSRPPSGASGLSEKQNVMYLSEDDDGRLADCTEMEDCCGLSARHQLHPNNLNLSLPLERDVYYPTVVCVKSRNPQDITPDSAVYLELNSPQTVDTPPTIREHPRRFPPFPSSSTSKNLPRPLAANPSPLRKSASFGNLSQLNQPHQNNRHSREGEQKKHQLLHSQSTEKSLKTSAPAPVSHSMEQLSCRACAYTSATDGECGKQKNGLSDLDGRQVRWRRWSSANELDPSSTSNSDSVYDSKDSVSFPSHDADEEDLDVTSGQRTFSVCASSQRSSVECHVKTARTSNCV